jgi:hypothetical protein
MSVVSKRLLATFYKHATPLPIPPPVFDITGKESAD